MRVKFLAAVLAVTLILGACAAAIPVEPLDPVEIEVRQRFVDLRGEVLPELVTFYGQAADTDPVPMVVLFHGVGDSRADMETLAQPLSERGLIVLNVDWSSDVGHMLESVADGPCAVAYAYENASDWNGDPERIIVIGHSAGVNVAILAALAPEVMVQCENRANSKVWAVIGVAGDPSNTAEGGILWNMMKDTRPEVLEAIDTYSYFGKNPDLKARFVNSVDDGTIDVERVDRFAQDMGAAGYDVEFLRVEGAGHGSLWVEEVLQIVDQLISQP